MFSRFQRFYTSIKVVTDLAMLSVAFGLAYLIRFGGPFPDAPPPATESWVSLVMVLVIFPLTFRQARLYATNRARSHWAMAPMALLRRQLTVNSAPSQDILSLSTP